MFQLNSYKMVYVFKSEDYMYRRTALLRAHQVFFFKSIIVSFKFTMILIPHLVYFLEILTQNQFIQSRYFMAMCCSCNLVSVEGALTLFFIAHPKRWFL